MSRVGRDVRLVFVGLWSLADDEGRFRADPRFITGQLLPYDSDGLAIVKKALVELEREGCVQLYEANGSHYGSVTGWKAHQKIDRPSQSRLPQPPEKSLANPREDSTKAREASCEEGMGKEQGEEGMGKEQGVEAPKEPAPEKPADDEGRPARLWVVRAPTTPPDEWSGDDFWKWAQSRRQEGGYAPEKHPRHSLGGWWNEVRSHVDAAALKDAFNRFGADPHWEKAQPPYPWNAFVDQLPKYLPQGAIRASSV